MLSKIRLQYFKKFKDTEITLCPFTVLMGENSSGKTTILQAINFALQGLYDLYTRSASQRKNGTVQIANKSKTYYIDELPALNISRVGELYYGGKASQAHIELQDLHDNSYRLQIQSTFGIYTRFGNFNFKCLSFTEKSTNTSTPLYQSQPLLISGFAGLNPTEERKFSQAIRERVQTGKMSEIIRNLVLDIKGQAGGKAYEQLSRTLEHHFNFHIDTVKFDQEEDLYITASFSEIRGGRRVSLNLNSSGSGLLQVLQILTPIYLFASKGTVVLLDEPDAHLHTNLQYALAQALREVQNELDIQIIISTHSIPMIEAADSSEVVPVHDPLQHHDQPQHIEPLTSKADVDQAIANLIDNYHLAKAKFSGKILFTEDKNIDILRGFDKAQGTGCLQGVNTIPHVLGGGKDNKAPFHSKNILKEYTKRDIEIHFIVDGDAMSARWRRHFAKFAEGKLILHQLAMHEIENYLINPDLLIRALKRKSRQKEKELPSVEELRSELTHIMRECMFGEKVYLKDDIKKRIDNLVALDAMVEETVIDKVTGQEKEELKYYGPDQKEREARKIAESYLSYTNFEQLVIVAPGKETLQRLNEWLAKAWKISLSHKDIIDCLTEKDVPDEIEHILKQLQINTTNYSEGGQKERQGQKVI